MKIFHWQFVGFSRFSRLFSPHCLSFILGHWSTDEENGWKDEKLNSSEYTADFQSKKKSETVENIRPPLSQNRRLSRQLNFFLKGWDFIVWKTTLQCSFGHKNIRLDIFSIKYDICDIIKFLKPKRCIYFNIKKNQPYRSRWVLTPCPNSVSTFLDEQSFVSLART